MCYIHLSVYLQQQDMRGKRESPVLEVLSQKKRVQHCLLIISSVQLGGRDL